MSVKRTLIIIISILLISHISFALKITEVMYNPQGSDNGREWIEIFNNQTNSINLTNYKFLENGIKHNLNLIQGSIIINHNESVIICDNSNLFLIDYPNYSKTILDSSFSLINSGENISIINNQNLIEDSLKYNTSLGASNNAKTLTYTNNSWIEYNASPGYQIYFDDVSNTNNTIINNNTTNQSQNPLINSSINITTNMTNNITNNNNNNNTSNITNNNSNLTKNTTNSSNSSTNSNNTLINYTNQIEIIQYINNPIANKSYDKMFKIINGANGDYYNLTINYNISRNHTLIKNDNYFKDHVHSFSYAQSGQMTFNDIGQYTICANIKEYTFVDENFKCTYNNNNNNNNSCIENLEDNNVCFNVTVINPNELNCNYSIKLETKKDYFVNEKIQYRFNVDYDKEDCKDLFYVNYIVSSNFLSNKTIYINFTSSSTSYKSFKPHISENDKIFLIEAKLYSFANNTNKQNNYDKIYALYFQNTSNQLNYEIIAKNGLICDNCNNLSKDIDYYRFETNDIGIKINGSINSDYLDIYIKKSTRYQSNKKHIEIPKNNYFSITDFINLDFLCHSNDINYFYSDSKIIESKYNLSKYFYFYDNDDSELKNITLYLKGPNIDIEKELQINKSQFCYLKYNSETVDKINEINPVFNTQYYMCNNTQDNNKNCKEEDTINKFEVTMPYYKNKISNQDKDLPLELIIKTNKDYTLNFNFEFLKTSRNKESIKIKSIKLCHANQCSNKCTNSKKCYFDIEKDQKYEVYFDIDLSNINLDYDKQLYEIRANYVKDNQKTIHSIDMPIIIENDYDTSKLKINNSNLSISNFKSEKNLNLNNLTLNNSSRNTVVLYQDTSSKLTNPLVDSLLSTISMLLFFAKLFKF